MSTKNARAVRSQRSFAERVAKWSGEFEGEGDKQQVSEMIVAYYNGTDIRDSKEAFIQTLVKAGFMAHFNDKLEVLAYMLNLMSFFHFPKGMDGKKAAEELKKHRTNFCAALRWLCSPKNPKPAVSAQQLKTLAGSMKLEWGRYPDIDETSERFVKYFEDHGLRHFRKRLALEGTHPKLPNDLSLEEMGDWYRQVEMHRRENNILIQYALPLHTVDLLCVFLLNECRDKQPSQMPVKLCPQCQRLFSVSGLEGKARERKTFCSTKCQQREYWKERKADYQYVKRLDPSPNSNTGMYSPSDLHRKLKEPETRERLLAMKERWKDWPKMLAMLQSLGF